MKTNDFSAPRRMSKSAFVIFLVNNLWLYAKYFLFIVILELFNSEKKLSFIEAALDFLVVLAICLTLAAVIAFINYYSKKYYVENGNLIFIHGLVRKEITSISLTKIHSLRTKQGLIYRLLDMKGVSFDTLASQSEEIEMILDNEDWEALLSRIETLDSQTQIQASEADKIEEKTDGYTTKLSVGNLNLIKGALCQNHLRGMVVFGSILVTLYDQIISVNENAVEYFYGYMATHADFLRLSLSSCITVAAILYIVTLLLWLGKVFLRYFNMDIRIDREQLFFESGLISRNSSRYSLMLFSILRLALAPGRLYADIPDKRDFCRTSEFYHFKRGLCGNQFRKVCRSEKLFQIFEHGSGSHDSYSFYSLLSQSKSCHFYQWFLLYRKKPERTRS